MTDLVLKSNIGRKGKDETARRLEQFLENLSDGQDKFEAAKNAGFTHPTRDAFPLIMSATAADYMAERIKLRMGTEGISTAWRVSLEMLRNPKTKDSVRWDIAKTLLAWGAGLVAPKGTAKTDADPDHMTPAELRKFIQEAENELAKRATTVTIDQQPIESIL